MRTTGEKPRLRPGLDRAAHRKSCGSGHHDVKQHEIHGLGASLFERLFAIFDSNDAVAVQAQQFGQWLADACIVICYQNGSFE